MIEYFSQMHRALAIFFVVTGFMLAWIVDYVTGLDIRVFPLYFLPLSLASWRFGRMGVILSTLAATAGWTLSNFAARQYYSNDYIWYINIMALAITFGMVAFLLASSRNLLWHEELLSRTDTLTGLTNARGFYELIQISIAICRRHEWPLTLAYIDIDNFKCINDRHGHAHGDMVLKDVAAMLRETLRSTDNAARIGGDEFIICLPETSATQAQPILERLRATIAEKSSTHLCAVSASIGAISWEEPQESMDTMISAADKLMYEVKKSGKNRVSIMTIPKV